MKISLIIPVYNVEKYLDKCLNSIICQDYDFFEAIIIDDGSTDNSKDIYNKYVKNDKRFKVIVQKNSGVSAARNAGINIATGDYVMFVDSDDTIINTACEELVNIIKDQSPDLICYNFRKVDSDGCTLDSDFYCTEDTKIVIKLDANAAIKDNIFRKHIRYEATSKIYKMSVAKKIEFPVGMYAEDFATFYKFLSVSSNILYYDRNIYNYFVRSNSIMGSKSVKLYKDIYAIENEFYEFCKTCNLDKTTLKKLDNNYFKSMIKIYSKLCISKNDKADNMVPMVYDKICQVNSANLSLKLKILKICFVLFKNSAAMFFAKIYKGL